MAPITFLWRFVGIMREFSGLRIQEIDNVVPSCLLPPMLIISSARGIFNFFIKVTSNRANVSVEEVSQRFEANTVVVVKKIMILRIALVFSSGNMLQYGYCSFIRIFRASVSFLDKIKFMLANSGVNDAPRVETPTMPFLVIRVMMRVGT